MSADRTDLGAAFVRIIETRLAELAEEVRAEVGPGLRDELIHIEAAHRCTLEMDAAGAVVGEFFRRYGDLVRSTSGKIC